MLWCGFDHGSIAGRAFGAMGFVDYFRLPKRQWYWYRNAYRHIPPPEWPSEGVAAGLRLTADKTVLQSADGTDDAQLILTVVDTNGKALNNSPPVTLTLVSGPGEFPTGPSITFAPDSDIAIRDGMAAIEFRSYYAGKSVIRATSPGLKEARVEITSRGGPAFVEGKTPPAASRPYVRFEENSSNNPQATFGRDNPTRVSSEAPGHSGHFANDGNPATFWQAAEGDKNPWLTLDLERIVRVSTLRVTFPSAEVWRYQAEISEDGQTGWTLIVDQSQNAKAITTGNDTPSLHPKGRFLRVSITAWPRGKPAAVAEVEVMGLLAQD